MAVLYVARLQRLSDVLSSILFIRSTHPQYIAVAISDFVCFRQMINDVRLGAVVNRHIWCPNLVMSKIIMYLQAN